MLTVIRKISEKGKYLAKKNLKCHYSSSTGCQLSEKDVEEIKIPVPWGHLAGKWWGDKSKPPTLALHGWQDNANTFDKLLPLVNIPNILAIDFPGHGLSSHLPPGKSYDVTECAVYIQRIRKYLNWNKISILGHSFGSFVGFAYCALYPENVKYYISIECARALLTLSKIILPQTLAKGVDSYLKVEKQKAEKTAPTYKLSQLISSTILGSMGSLNSIESAMTLIKRGIAPAAKSKILQTEKYFETDLKEFFALEKINFSKLSISEKEVAVNYSKTAVNNLKKIQSILKDFKLQEEEDKYFKMIRDPLVKVHMFQSYDEDFLAEACKIIKCPVLSIRAKEGFLYGSTRKLYEMTVSELKKNLKHCEHHEVEGTHHLHLTNPELIAPIINDFVEKVESGK